MSTICLRLTVYFSAGVALWSSGFHGVAGAEPPATPTYWQNIRPLLRKNCFACHNRRNLKERDVSGGLALDSYEAIRIGGERPILKPGKSGDSLLVQLVTSSNEEKRMPLGATPLPAESIALLRRWIDTGAREGQKPTDAPAVTSSSHRSRARKRDVLLTTNAVPPRNLAKAAKPARLELAVKVGPLAPIAAVAFSPDGKLLATGSYRQVTIWDLGQARPIKMLTNLLGAVNDLRFSPDGHLLAVAGGQPSAKGDLRLYQVADWKLAGVLAGHDDVVFGVAFHPDGKRLASASFDKTVRIWDVATHKTLRTLSGHSDFVYAVAFSPDGKWLASASKDRSVKVVETETGKSRFTLGGVEQDVLAVAISPDGKNVVSSGLDVALNWWNPQTGRRVRAQGGHGIAVHEICFSKDGRLVASAGADRTVRLWNGSTGAPVRSLTVGSIVYAVALSPTGKLLASGSFDGLVRLWDPASGRLLVTLLGVSGEGERLEWLEATPEGYVASSEDLPALARWQAGGQPVSAEPIWKALRQPELLARAVQGEKLAPPRFGTQGN
jgi:WD40 repeat protein